MKSVNSKPIIIIMDHTNTSISILLEFKENLICKLCNSFVSNPMVYQSCEHFFCDACLVTYGKTKNCFVCNANGVAVEHRKRPKLGPDNAANLALSQWLSICSAYGVDGLGTVMNKNATKHLSKSNKVIDRILPKPMATRGSSKTSPNESIPVKTSVEAESDDIIEPTLLEPRVTRRNTKHVANALTSNKIIAPSLPEPNQTKTSHPDKTKERVTSAIDMSIEGRLLNTTDQSVDMSFDSSGACKNINKRNRKGETALHVACVRGNLETLRLLIAQGARPNTQDHAGWTPLHEAVKNGNKEIVTILLEMGALPDVPAVGNLTPLQEAVMANRIDIAKLLLKHGASIYTRNSNNDTAMTLASSKEMKEFLLETSVNIDQSAIEEPILTQEPERVVLYCPELEDNTTLKVIAIVSAHSNIQRVFQMSSEVTHVVVATNEMNVCEPSLYVWRGIIEGKWIISNAWITVSAESGVVADFSLFEVVGTTNNPNSLAPKRSRLNRKKRNPGLFNGCHFYFSGPTSFIRWDNDRISINKSNLAQLVKLGGGVNLIREPNPESIPTDEQLIPFHVHPGSSLSICSHYIIYRMDIPEPLIKYTMKHIKTLPVHWLIDCIENFKLLDPLPDFLN